MISGHYLKKFSSIHFKPSMCAYWVSVQNWFPFGPHWLNFSPLVPKILLKVVVSDHHGENYSLNPIETWCVYFLCESSEMIWFGPCCPSFGLLVAPKWLKMMFFYQSAKLIIQSTSVLVYTLVGWVFRIHSFFGPWTNFGPLVAKKLLKMVVSDHYLKNYSLNLVETWCVHLFGESSEMIWFGTI